jgi:alpha-tubulin suppressor-like RCC1 family protein
MTQSNYQINAVDLDSTYIPGNDPNYVGIQAAVSNRKTVVFGQQLLSQTFPVGNINNAINYVQNVPTPIVDQDSTIITGVGSNSVFYKNRFNPSQSLIRATFGTLLENYPQNLSWQLLFSNQSSPILLTSYANNWVSVTASGSFSTNNLSNWSVGIQSPGTLWSWGVAYLGGTGNNSTYNFTLPVQVGNLSTWTQISSSFNSVIALQSNGTLWAWGGNSWGQLGQGNLTHYSSPVQVGALTTWSKINCGYTQTGVIKTDGTLWVWGNNSYGQLGLNTLTNFSSPVQVGALTTWSQISFGGYHAIALQNNGTLWSCGYNGQGQLGLNTSTNYSSFVQVGALTSWSQISSGNSFWLALQNNGTLWANGYNPFGALGTSNGVTTSSPVQVGALTTWTQISGGAYNSFAIQSNGTLWAWGSNNTGQLGINSSVNAVYSPVQVGGLSNWSKIFGYRGTTITNQSYSAGILSSTSLYVWGNNSTGNLGLTPLGISVTKITYGL